MIVIKLGEIAKGSYFYNKHGMLLRGDTIEEMSKLPDKSIHMILADLPYGTTRNKWDSIIPLDKLWEQYERIIVDDGAIVLTAQTPFDKVLGSSNLKLLKYEWIWIKSKPTGHLNSKYAPMKKHENILVFSKAPTSYVKSGTNSKYIPQGLTETNKIVKRTNKGNYDVEAGNTTVQTQTGFPDDVLFFNGVQKTIHPTQKPVELFEYLIKTYTNEGEIVLDNTSGSGTTAEAAEISKRKWICIERDLDENGNSLGYCDATIDRLKKLHSETA